MIISLVMVLAVKKFTMSILVTLQIHVDEEQKYHQFNIHPHNLVIRLRISIYLSRLKIQNPQNQL
jgi:hypothetical protein